MSSPIDTGGHRSAHVDCHTDSADKADAQHSPNGRPTPPTDLRLHGLRTTSSVSNASKSADRIFSPRLMLPPGRSAGRLALTAGSAAQQYFTSERAALFASLLDAARSARALRNAPTPGQHPPLPIIGARVLSLRPFVHQSASTYSIITRDHPSFFAHATLDDEGTLHVQDVTRFADANGREHRVKGLNSLDFIRGALEHFGDNVRSIHWQWDRSGDNVGQFNELLPQHLWGLRQSIENTRTGAYLEQAGFALTHTEVATSRITDTGPVYDAITVRWKVAQAIDDTKPDDEGVGTSLIYFSAECDLSSAKSPEQRASMITEAADRIEQQFADNDDAPIVVGRCLPETAQYIADASNVPVTVESTLIDGQPAVYLPRMYFGVADARELEAVVWMFRYWTLHRRIPNDEIVLLRHYDPHLREQLQSLADRTGLRIAWSGEAPFWGDDIVASPTRDVDSAPTTYANMPRDGTVVISRPLLEPEVDPASPQVLGTIDSIPVVERFDALFSSWDAHLRARGGSRHVDHALAFDSSNVHSPSLAQAIADQYDIRLEIMTLSGDTQEPSEARPDRFSVALTYHPRLRCRVTHKSVREFADYLRRTGALPPSGIVIHPDSLPTEWRDIKNEALQALADLLKVPVALARFDDRRRDDNDEHLSATVAESTDAAPLRLYRDERLFQPQSISFEIGEKNGDASSPAALAASPRVVSNFRDSVAHSQTTFDASARALPSILEDLEARLAAIRDAIALAREDLAHAREAADRAESSAVRATEEKTKWQGRAMLQELDSLFPADMFGTISGEFKKLALRWVNQDLPSDARSPEFDALISEVASATKLRQHADATALGDAERDANLASEAARKKLDSARVQLADQERSAIALYEAWDAAHAAVEVVGRALSARSAAERRTSNVNTAALADEIAGQANDALFELYQRLEALASESNSDDRSAG
ncbi:hypothetical protein LJR230_004053 [Trinickia sp. LjRoot230]|uniref:hypothetical protein n=1 Tax=Trinickia sp. LjRoot230 TaxID=3342288 RepID=UPI003ECC61B1